MEIPINRYQGALFKIKFTPLSNGSFLASLVQVNLTGNLTDTVPRYDDRGALIYVVAVVCIYGLSILLMIASVIKKSKSDHGLSKYMNEIDKVRRIEKRQEKLKTRMAIQKARVADKSKGDVRTTESLKQVIPLCTKDYVAVGPACAAAVGGLVTSSVFLDMQQVEDNSDPSGWGAHLTVGDGCVGMGNLGDASNAASPSPSTLQTVTEELEDRNQCEVVQVVYS